MSFFNFLISYSKVESVLGLLSFIIAATLGFLAYQRASKLKGIAKIVSLADTRNKSDLAKALLEVIPSYKIPDLNKAQGFEIIKLQMQQKSVEFKSKMNLLRLGMIIFSVIVILILVQAYFKFEQTRPVVNAETHGNKSPILVGDSNQVNYVDTTNKK
ncbi:hypothetical protein [Chitinophaga sp. MM2321]|uniref:hypothetical protein n=1 Tax=Chitinophaga sp. MM2321 TaxID=3137178 RepID=UPI0032D59858